MRIGHILPLILIVVVFFQSCRKKEVYTAPLIQILAPTANSTYNLPNKMYVELKVTSQNEIKFIRVNIDESDLNPLFVPRFLYPENNDVQIAFTLNMDNIPTNNSPPYYLHIAVDDGSKLTHEYLEINLINAPLKYKGFNLITYSNQTNIILYDKNNIEKKTTTLSGEYVDAETSTKEQMFFLATSTPSMLYGFDQDKLEIMWFDEPEMPYPYYTDLYEDGNYLYVGFGNERIAAYDGFSGIQKVGTSILVDSVPLKVGAANSYFVGYFEKRTALKKALVSFYMATGAIYNKLEMDISIVDLYPKNIDVLSVFGNKNGKGIAASYFIDENNLGEMTVLPEGLISNSCLIENDLFLISIESKVYAFDFNSNYIDLKLDMPDVVKDIQYDPVNKVIYVGISNGVYIYRYPDYSQLNIISSEKPIKALRLYYGY